MPAPRRDAKVVVVLPARNAARVLERTLDAIPRDWVDELIVVDDPSGDGTAAALARRIPQVHVVWRPHHAGYGASAKAGYLAALEHGADVVVALHPDGRFEPLLIPRLVAPVADGRADVVLGSRFLTPGGPLQAGMPRKRYTAGRALAALQNRMLGTGFSDLHTGYRAYSRRLLLHVPWLRNAPGLSFDAELLLQAVHVGFRVEEVPASTIYAPDPDVARREGAVAGARTLVAAAMLAAHRRSWWRSRRYLP